MNTVGLMPRRGPMGRQQEKNMTTYNIPPDWKLVPVEPTGEMDEEGSNAVFGRMLLTSNGDIEYQPLFASGCYRAMLAAAPEPPEQEPSQSAREKADRIALRIFSPEFKGDWFEARDLIEKALAGDTKPPEVVVKVKPLVWTEQPPRGRGFALFVKWAAGIGGWYRLEPSGLLSFAGDDFSREQFGSQAEAKAAAQADYEARIMAAIEVKHEEI